MRTKLLFAALTILTMPLVPAAIAAPTPAADKSSSTDNADGIAFFEKRIRPVLGQQCYKCHASTSEKVKGGLVLDSRAGALQGGETGPAVVPGHPEKSLLIEAVRYTNDDMKMPPKNRLPANVVADLTKWVQMGAPWPNETVAVGAQAPAAPSYTANYDKLRKEHWAWQPITDKPAPAVKNTAWPANDVDRFVLAKLEARGLKPVADADKATLIRRVTFDLTGLPPTPEEVAAFVADRSPAAYEKRVDQLLATPAFGECWGRHWLDTARFAESTGSTRNVPYHWAWRYRDYVIDAFNKDKPYNTFISEQIAGDLMPCTSAQQHNELLTATGFLAIGVKDLNERDRGKYVMDNVDEQIDVTTRSIMALTVSCARCHDHKFDPIPTTDYYALAGIFKSTEILSGVHGRQKGGAKKDYDAPDELYAVDGTGQKTPSAQSTISSTGAGRIDALQARAATLHADLLKLRADGAAKPAERKAIRQELAAIEAQIGSAQNGTAAASANNEASAGSSIMGVRDLPQPSDTNVCLHGEPHDLGQIVPRGFVSVVPVHSAGSSVDPAHSGRLQLAQWLTSSENPLTPRVMVNRIWAHLFGQGIVRTVDNFGSTGEAPADPELLDHLASQFMTHGWSIKSIVRGVVLSHSYRLSSASDPADFMIDPENRLVWHMDSRRLDAEEIRDAILAAAGTLDLSHPQGSLAAALPVAELRNVRTADGFARTPTRSVYLPILRDLIPPVLELFDFAEPTMVIGSRDTTTVPTQALFLMNDPFVIEQSSRMAGRLQNATGLDDAGRANMAYRLALGRDATPAEKARAIKYVGEFQHEAAGVTRDSLKTSRSDAWASFCQALFASAEFRYLN